jgi:FkbM family methyltransferase
VDCGVGDNPDFSLALIEGYGLRCHAFEPTLRHHPALETLVHRLDGQLILHKEAIGTKAGSRRFFESEDNVSGSFFQDHVNILRDRTVSYAVSVVTLDQILSRFKDPGVELLKLDIEGEEYPVFEIANDSTLRCCSQWIVEFHHYCVDRYQEKHTLAIVHRMRGLGFRDFTHDGKTYLFFKAPSEKVGQPPQRLV